LRKVVKTGFLKLPMFLPHHARFEKRWRATCALQTGLRETCILDFWKTHLMTLYHAIHVCSVVWCDNRILLERKLDNTVLYGVS